MAELGWDDFFEVQRVALERPELRCGRVAVERRGRYDLITERGSLRARLTGKFMHEAGKLDMPAVGDWVLVDKKTIEHVLTRRSRFVRLAAGGKQPQVVAANVDVVFVVCGLDSDFNPRRIERYVSTVWESGAVPVIVLNKADLIDDLDPYLAETSRVAPGAAVHATAAKVGDLSELLSHLGPGQTGALVGSSGVGKSTIMNALLGGPVQAVADVREADSRGRHTTTHRELFVLEGGGLLIDTPGMRELGLWGSEAGVAEAFPDIVELIDGCRFRDCGHDHEPGCAVKGAVSPDRLASWQKLMAELAFVERKEDVGAQRAFKREVAKIHKEILAIKKDSQ